LVALVAFLPGWNLLRFSAGLFRVSIARQIIESNKWALPRLDYYKDGVSTTVSVEQWVRTVALKNNGKVDASNGDDMATQIMVGLMPLLFHHDALVHPPRVAVIGFGSGVTIGAVTQFPIGHADVVELEPRVVEAGSRFFGAVNHHPELDSRVRVVIDDGRSFLSTRHVKDDLYDAIVSEPSNPWIAGVSNLFTVDYWKIARARLKDDGVFCQWAQLYEMSPRNVKILLRSFSSVFPYTYVFAAEDLSSDVIMVASNHPLQLDLSQLRRNFVHPTLGPELHRGGVDSAEDLIAYLLLTPEELPAFTVGAPLNTDDNALIEYAAPRDLLGTFKYDPYLARVYGTDWPYGRFEEHLVGLGEGDAHKDSELRLARALLAHGRRGPGMRFLERARSQGAPPDNATAKLFEALDLRTKHELEVPLGTPGDGDPLGIDDLDVPHVGASAKKGDADNLARDYLEMAQRARAGDYGRALIKLKEWPEYLLTEGGPDLQLLVGLLLYKIEMYGEAIDRLKPLLADDAYVVRRPALLYYIARAEYGDAIYDAAVRNMERYLASRVAK
jgi:spermidine synthase